MKPNIRTPKALKKDPLDKENLFFAEGATFRKYMIFTQTVITGNKRPSKKLL